MPSRKADRMLSRLIPSRQDFLDGMLADLREWPDRMDTLFATAEETAAAAEIAIKARLSVLLRVYAGEYHTDSFDITRLAERIRRGEESIVFWGAAEEIARLRTAFVTGDLPPDLQLGTNTLLCAEEEWGDGYCEFTRNGSMSTTVRAIRPFLWRTYSFLSGIDAHTHQRYHTLFGVLRNRASAPGIRGGELMQQITVRYLRSRFWGWLPFYVMQGGVLEQNDYVEMPRDPSDVSQALAATPRWYFAAEREAGFAADLVRLNNLPVPETVVVAPTSAPTGRFEVLLPPRELIATNHGTVLPCGERQSGQGLTDAVEEVINAGVSCCAVRLPLADAGSVDEQQWLLDRGFRLTAISPPTHSWIVRHGTRRHVRREAVGIWTRPRPDLHIEPPFYVDLVTAPDERKVVAYLDSL